MMQGGALPGTDRVTLDAVWRPASRWQDRVAQDVARERRARRACRPLSSATRPAVRYATTSRCTTSEQASAETCTLAATLPAVPTCEQCRTCGCPAQSRAGRRLCGGRQSPRRSKLSIVSRAPWNTDLPRCRGRAGRRGQAVGDGRARAGRARLHDRQVVQVQAHVHRDAGAVRAGARPGLACRVLARAKAGTLECGRVWAVDSKPGMRGARPACIGQAQRARSSPACLRCKAALCGEPGDGPWSQATRAGS